MDIDNRKLDLTQKFENLKTERQQLLDMAQNKYEEMLKLQGAYSLLEDMEQGESIDVNVKVKGEGK